ncbi:hypothetical protein DL96DRAFT_235611 [Flagelloscypha sp. PMI_526]|nr:hypothetical protein DL96DRAFT_235611 [Flagelloscypha sp. PMI_526]
MITCKFCNCQFPSGSALNIHIRGKPNHGYCPVCQRVFVNTQALNQHLSSATLHRGEREERYCQFCDREFVNAQSLWQHRSSSHNHHWCYKCPKDFPSVDMLTQHNSTVHKVNDLKCPLCSQMFAAPSAIAQHIESGGCSSKITRHHVTRAVQSLKISPTITVTQLIEGPSPLPKGTITYHATELAWNGNAYECYLCHKTCRKLSHLNDHFNSAAHDDDEFQCPGPKCGSKFALVSGLIQHIESGSCGVSKFQEVKNRMLDITSRFTKALTL